MHIRELVELLQEIGCLRIQTLVRRGKPGYYFYLIWSTQIQLTLNSMYKSLQRGRKLIQWGLKIQTPQSDCHPITERFKVGYV